MSKSSGSGSGYSHHVIDGLARFASSHGSGSGQQNSSQQTSKPQGDNKLGHIAQLGAMGATAIAKYESKQAKTDPANAEKHRKQEKLAGAVALGLTGYAAQEARKNRKEQNSSESRRDKFAEGKKLLQSVLK